MTRVVCVNFILFLTAKWTITADVDYSNAMCKVNPSLPARANDNYVNCKTDEMTAEGRTSCCEVEGEKGCCNASGEWSELILICVVIGVTSLIIAALCFYKLWCNDQTFPCLVTCRQKLADCRRRDKSPPDVFGGKSREKAGIEENDVEHREAHPRPVVIPVNPKRALMWGTEIS